MDDAPSEEIPLRRKKQLDGLLTKLFVESSIGTIRSEMSDLRTKELGLPCQEAYLGTSARDYIVDAIRKRFDLSDKVFEVTVWWEPTGRHYNLVVKIARIPVRRARLREIVG